MADEAAPCLRTRALSRTALRAELDLSHVTRPRATRSRVRQAMAQLALTLDERPSVRSVVVVVRTGTRAATTREWSCATAAADGLHRRFEMTHGEPLALAVVLADDATPEDDLARCLRGDARRIPDGVACMTWDEVRARGISASAAFDRI
jgi:hypothetical protein